MTEAEFKLLEKHVNTCHLIKNEGGIRSYFESTTSSDLFSQSKLNQHV